MEKHLKSSCPETLNNLKTANEEELECAVCLQSCVHPVRLPCSHIFCFLCVKGVANQSKRCAMCRQEIPADFLENPNLLKKVEEKESDPPDGYQWFYEGRNGWWQYDERTSKELEFAFSRGDRVFEVLVAGFLYTVDFDKMVQQRRNDPSRRRRIKRDLASIPKKGVAGLKTILPPSHSENQSENIASSSSSSEVEASILSPVSHLDTTENEQNQENISITNDVNITFASSSSRDSTVFESPTRFPSEYQVPEYLHLLHTDLQQGMCSHNTPETSRTSSSSSEISINETLSSRVRPYPVTMRNSNNSQNTNDNREILRTQVHSNSPSPSSPLPSTNNSVECSDFDSSISTITNYIDNLIIDSNDATEAQYYSLDDSVEYNLPHTNDEL